MDGHSWHAVVPEQTTHTLDELVAFYTRTPFLIWISLLSVALLGVVGLAHLTEWSLERRTLAAPLTPRTPSRKRTRRWSHVPGGHRAAPPPLALATQHPSSRSEPLYGTFRGQEETADQDELSPGGGKPRPHLALDLGSADLKKPPFDLTEEAVARSRLILGVAYGGASGTLSGLCLLFAKTGIELLILTVVGQNQFGRVEAWAIVAVLLVAAVLQLFYLNRALRLVGPTLICPLAFCFYNLSSIVSGLVYYDQWDQLSWLQFALVALGTGVLLGGVWLVSVIKKDDHDQQPVQLTGAGPFSDEPEGMSTPTGEHTEDEEEDESEDDEEDEEVEWIPRGLTIGIGAASPGFDIRPRRRATLASLPLWSPPSPSQANNASRASAIEPTERSPLFPAQHPSPQAGHRRTLSSEADLDSSAPPGPHASPRRQPTAQIRRAYRDRERAVSLSHAPYVGRRDSAPLSPSIGPLTTTANEGGHQALHGLGLPEGSVETAVEREDEQRSAEERRRKAGWKKLRARFAAGVLGGGAGRD